MTINTIIITDRKKNGNLSVFHFQVGVNSVTKLFVQIDTPGIPPIFQVAYKDGSVESYVGLKFMYVLK